MTDIISYSKVHFIGIGGINMSSLADILLYRGYGVSGSDSRESGITDQLKKSGADIFIGQRAANIPQDCDLVVYTAAIHPDNPELVRAKELGIRCLSRAEFLGILMKDFDDVVCVSGTHGKTTTTSMLGGIFTDAGKDPTIMCGGIMSATGSQTRIGGDEFLIAESCEYTNSFLSFFPTIAVILNIKADHLDFFKDIDDIRASFKHFAQLLPDNGTLVLCDSIEEPGFLTEGLSCSVITFGLNESSDIHAGNISYDKFARGGYDLYIEGNFAGHVRLTVPGEHGIIDSLGAVAASYAAGIDPQKAVASLCDFKGVKRRFEIKGEFDGITVIDDYAHHPDEINATLNAALKLPRRKMWVVFQPHTYSRTVSLMDEFAGALCRADAVVLTDIYAAREKNTFGVSSKDLCDRINELGGEAYYCPTFDETENFLLENCMNGDMLITMGAGDVVKIGENLLGV